MIISNRDDTLNNDDNFDFKNRIGKSLMEENSTKMEDIKEEMEDVKEEIEDVKDDWRMPAPINSSWADEVEEEVRF